MTAWKTAIPIVPPSDRVSSHEDVDEAISFRGMACKERRLAQRTTRRRRNAHSLNDDQRDSQRQSDSKTSDDKDNHLGAYRLSICNIFDCETVT